MSPCTDQKIHYWVHPTLDHMNPIYTVTEFLEYLTLKKRALQTVERLELFTQRHHVISQKIWIFTIDFLKIHLNISLLCQGLQTDLLLTFYQHVTCIATCMSADIIIEETDQIYGLKFCALKTKSLIIHKGNLAGDKAIRYIRHKAITLQLERSKWATKWNCLNSHIAGTPLTFPALIQTALTWAV